MNSTPRPVQGCKRRQMILVGVSSMPTQLKLHNCSWHGKSVASTHDLMMRGFRDKAKTVARRFDDAVNGAFWQRRL